MTASSDSESDNKKPLENVQSALSTAGSLIAIATFIYTISATIIVNSFLSTFSNEIFSKISFTEILTIPVTEATTFTIAIVSVITIIILREIIKKNGNFWPYFFIVFLTLSSIDIGIDSKSNNTSFIYFYFYLFSCFAFSSYIMAIVKYVERKEILVAGALGATILLVTLLDISGTLKAVKLIQLSEKGASHLTLSNRDCSGCVLIYRNSDFLVYQIKRKTVITNIDDDFVYTIDRSKT